jgi:hypothetical protein
VPVTILKPAVVIAGSPSPGIGGGPGASNMSDIETGIGIQGIWEIGGSLFQMVVNGQSTGQPPISPTPNVYQWYKSTDGGNTWTAFGPSIAVGTKQGVTGVLASDGFTIWISYPIAPISFGNGIAVQSFDTSAGTWGSQLTFDPNTGIGFTQMNAIGPWAGFLRPDGSIVFIYADANAGQTVAIIFSAPSTFTRVYLVQPPGGTGTVDQGALMAPDGTVHLFWEHYADHTYLHLSMDPTNVVSAPFLIHTGTDISDWTSPGGLGWGVLNAGTFYLGVGKQSGGDYQAAIMFGNDSGGWTLGNLLDPGLGPGWYVYNTPAIFLLGGTLVYRVQYIDTATGSHYIERIGYAALADYNTPANWTWVTAYDYNVSSPAIPGETAPYQPANFETTFSGFGLSYALMHSATGRLRMSATLINSGGTIFTAFLLDIGASIPIPPVPRAYAQPRQTVPVPWRRRR